MTADVSSLNPTPNALITQDLLAGLSRPHFLSRQSCVRDSPVSPMSSSSSSDYHRKQSMSSPAPELQDLNYPPTKTPSWSLELKLEWSWSTRSNYESVCTLDKVKSALQRAEQGTMKKRQSFREEKESKTTSSSGMFAAACPGCLLYVITQKTNPKCPRCDAVVACPPAAKKPRIDLNSMQQFQQN